MELLEQKILILDQGSKYYKGILIEYGFGNFNIKKVEKLPVLTDLALLPAENHLKIDLQENLETELAIFEYNFLRFTKTLFTDQKDIIFLFSNDKVFSRNIEVPAEKKEVALQIVENEIENYLPYSLDDVQVLSSIIKLENGIASVLSFAIKNDVLERYAKIIIENGFSLRMIGIESVSLYNAIELLPEEEYNKKTIIQIDIGYSKTLINIIEKGKLAFCRFISFGIINLLLILKKYFYKVNEDELESYLFQYFIDFLKEKEIQLNINQYEELCKEFLEEWNDFISEIKKTILNLKYDYYSYILISGSGSLIPNLSEKLEEDLNLQVKRYEIQLGDEKIEPWIIAIGSIFHYKKSQKERIDFLNTPIGKSLRKGEIQLKAFNVPVILSIISMLVFLISFIIGILLERRQLQSYQLELQKIAESIPGVGGTINPVAKAKKICEDKLNYWKNIYAGNRYLDVIKEVSEHTVGPDVANIQFKSLRYTESQIFLELVVDSIGNVVKVQEEFQKSRMFSVVEVIRRDLIAGQKVRLELSLKIKPPNIKFDVGCK